jgi:hypothetical protein
MFKSAFQKEFSDEVVETTNYNAEFKASADKTTHISVAQRGGTGGYRQLTGRELLRKERRITTKACRKLITRNILRKSMSYVIDGYIYRGRRLV